MDLHNFFSKLTMSFVLNSSLFFYVHIYIFTRYKKNVLIVPKKEDAKMSV